MSATVWLTPEQAAERLPVGNANWIRAQLRNGQLEGSQINGRWLIDEAAIEAMVRNRSTTQRRQRRRRSTSA